MLVKEHIKISDLPKFRAIVLQTFFCEEFYCHISKKQNTIHEKKVCLGIKIPFDVVFLFLEY